MITLRTQAAIATLNDIYYGEEDGRKTGFLTLSDEERCSLLGKLADAGMICLTDRQNPQKPSSYKPASKPADISLLDILEATGEHLNCNRPTTEQFYERYGKTGAKLGVINHMTRLYLQEIKLSEL